MCLLECQQRNCNRCGFTRAEAINKTGQGRRGYLHHEGSVIFFATGSYELALAVTVSANRLKTRAYYEWRGLASEFLCIFEFYGHV
jgi:hypothetical protein